MTTDATDTAPVLTEISFPSAEISKNPYGFYERLREEAVSQLPDGNTYLVSRYDDVMNILSDRDLYSSRRPWLEEISPDAQSIMASGWPSTTMIAGEDPPEHTIHKKLAMPAVSKKRLGDIKQTIYRLANQLIDDFADDGSADFVAQYAQLLPIMVISEILQVSPKDVDLFRKWANDTLSMLAGGLSYEREIECAQSTVDFQRYVHRIVQARRAQLDQTMISDLIRAQDDTGQGISDGEIINICLLILRAGFETTVHLLGTMMKELLSKPEQMDRLRRDPALIRNTVEEALRFESPLQYTTRLATADVVIGGVRVPAGAKLLLMLASANRDEKAFAEPGEFNIARDFDKPHVGFGYGVHSCLGAQIARDEGIATLEVMLSRFKDIRLADSEAPFSYVLFPPILRGLRSLNITYEKA